VSAAAAAVLAGRQNIRVLLIGPLAKRPTSELEYRGVVGGLLVQTRDTALADPATFKIVTQKKPTPTQYADLWFAWRVCKYVKSNAIVFARDGMTIGVGAGQMSRVYSTRVAALKANDEGLQVEGSSMASDAFFPFRDGIDVAAEYGIKAIVQPGGSKRDEEVIAAADEHGMTMVFTGMRHFRH
jgi:phosphoribosylaminoimidazolecarboxamide formyltransferase/IMP cyclohydrolase